jgi:Mlc titration factor MtfA (ptsG expression regulator)
MGPFQVFLIVVVGVVILGYFSIMFVEPLYVLIFGKTLCIRWYPFRKKIKLSQRNILKQEFSFYQQLSVKRQQMFDHRVTCFMARYKFIGNGGFVLTDQCRVLIAATYVMLTFGMRHYLIDAFSKIIIYPQPYFSTITQEYHKGEFNPGMKILVFSWSDFQEGFRYENDNINLGLHEFSHALYFHGLKSRDQSSIVFADAYNKMQIYLTETDVLSRLVNSDYFRIYAYTNQLEFLAVIFEHFFESPKLFKRQFPELYNYVSEMINFDETILE